MVLNRQFCQVTLDDRIFCTLSIDPQTCSSAKPRADSNRVLLSLLEFLISTRLMMFRAFIASRILLVLLFSAWGSWLKFTSSNDFFFAAVTEAFSPSLLTPRSTKITSVTTLDRATTVSCGTCWGSPRSPFTTATSGQVTTTTPTSSSALYSKYSSDRRKKLGLNDEDDEYDLGTALENNTDSTISKIIAGSFIVTMIALLVIGLIIPYTTDYGDGVCNPILTQGRC